MVDKFFTSAEEFPISWNHMSRGNNFVDSAHKEKQLNFRGVGSDIKIQIESSMLLFM